MRIPHDPDTSAARNALFAVETTYARLGAGEAFRQRLEALATQMRADGFDAEEMLYVTLTLEALAAGQPVTEARVYRLVRVASSDMHHMGL